VRNRQTLGSIGRILEVTTVNLSRGTCMTRTLTWPMKCARVAWTIAIGAGAGGTFQGSVGEGSGIVAIILKNTRGPLVQGPVWVHLDVS